VSTATKLAAADAIAGLIGDEDRAADRIIPSPFDPRVVPAVAAAVAEHARREGTVAL
jgi:malate dehydrogenase (oxaloacetate-decarboxylating)